MTSEQLVSTYLRGEGADVANAERFQRRMVIAYPDHGDAARALLVCAAIRIGFTFKARGKLAPACEYQGRAAIGGTDAEPTSSDPWWCLVNFVEAAQ